MKIIKLKYRAFTLVELLAVIGLIAILSMVVTTSAQRITKEVRLSTALNQVMSAVSEARSIAIRDRTEVLVAFTVYRKTVRVFPDYLEQIDWASPQQTQIILAKRTGRFGWPIVQSGVGSYELDPDYNAASAINPPPMCEEFVPITDQNPQLLPVGIKVAGSGIDIMPYQGQVYDDVWLSQPSLEKKLTETYETERGSMVVIRFNQDGTLITRSSSVRSNITNNLNDIASTHPWIDINRNGKLDIFATPLVGNSKFFALDELNDETLCNHTMSLAIFDDEKFHAEATPVELEDWRKYISIAHWMNGFNKARTDFINRNAEQIQFNRFSGVAEFVPR